MIYMKKIKEPAYFLNSIKETHPFDDEKDLIKKIKESKDFRRNPDMAHKQEELNKKIVLDKLDGLISIFENYEVCSNQILILGSLDYFRLALKRENLKKQQKDELLKVIFEYGEHIENFYFTMRIHPEHFSYYDLTPVEEEFDRLQHYIEDLGILPRLYDENVDLSIFLEDDELSCNG